MAEFVWTNAFFLYGGRDFACQFSNLSVSFKADMLDRTAFCDDTRRMVAGLLDTDGTLDAYFAASTSSTDSTGSGGYTDGAVDGDVTFDQEFFNMVGDAGQIYAFGATRTTGNFAHFGNSLNASYEVGGAVGELTKLGISFSARGERHTRGVIGISGQSTAVTITGDGYDLKIPGSTVSTEGMTAGYSLQAAVFALGSTAGTADIIVESSSEATFAVPTTRATFTQLTSTGAEFITVAGPITDTAFRFVVTQGSTPSFNLVCIFGVTKD